MINPFDEDPGDLALSHMKRDVGPEKEKFSVAASFYRATEGDRLYSECVRTKELLEQHIGDRIWVAGHGAPTSVEEIREDCNYGKTISIGVTADAENKESLRQWAYRYVSIARAYQQMFEEERKKNDRYRRGLAIIAACEDFVEIRKMMRDEEKGEE